MEELPYRKNIVALDQRVLIISDMHHPYAHPDWYAFLVAVKKYYKPEIVINVGDEIDNHAISFHKSDSSLFSADHELEKAIKELQHLNKLFPKMYICESNHGSLAYRRFKSEGIPIRHLKDLPDLYGTPQWEWHHEIVLDTHMGKVVIVHGKTGAYNKLALEQGCSAIQGHFHQKFELTWAQSSLGPRFNMIVGCLIDQKSMAFAYGKNIAKRPIQGVGFLGKTGEPLLIRMNLNEEGRWDGRI